MGTGALGKGHGRPQGKKRLAPTHFADQGGQADQAHPTALVATRVHNNATHGGHARTRALGATPWTAASCSRSTSSSRTIRWGLHCASPPCVCLASSKGTRRQQPNRHPKGRHHSRPTASAFPCARSARIPTPPLMHTTTHHTYKRNFTSPPPPSLKHAATDNVSLRAKAPLRKACQ